MQLTILGSGTARPTHRRASAGYLLEWAHGALLLDPSAGTYMRALKAGLEPKRLVAVVLSHLHADHTADLPGLLFARKQEKLETEIAIAGPRGTADLLRRARSLYGDETPARVEPFPWRAEGLAVEAFPARHSEESVCLRIVADGKTLAYSGDTGDCEGLRAACAGADLALLECTAREPKEGHLSPAECEAVAAATAATRVLLTHIGPGVEPTLPAAEDGLVVSI
ncbi:MAG: ribonuclease Z [Planctomycetes bacterium]|nr:ribonuclease Z [Planctomycetota bacterium]